MLSVSKVWHKYCMYIAVLGMFVYLSYFYAVHHKETWLRVVYSKALKISNYKNILGLKHKHVFWLKGILPWSLSWCNTWNPARHILEGATPLLSTPSQILVIYAWLALSSGIKKRWERPYCRLTWHSVIAARASAGLLIKYWDRIQGAGLQS